MLKQSTDPIVDPKVIQSRLTDVVARFSGILEEFVRYSALTKITPDYQAYATSSQIAERELHTINSDLVSMSASIDDSSETIARKSLELNRSIADEKKRHGRIKRLIANANPTGSEELIGDFTVLYNAQYAKNVMALIGICAVVRLTSGRINSSPG